MLVELRPIAIEKWHGKKDKESFTQPKVVEALYNDETGGYATGLTKEEEAKYGNLLGVPLDNTFNPVEAHPTWSSKPFWIKLENFTQVFDTSKALDFVRVKLLKSSKFVANSKKVLEAGEAPDATHVIYDETEEVELKVSKIQAKNEAIALLPKINREGKISLVRLLSKKGVRGKSDDFIAVELDSLITEDPLEFLRVAKLGGAEVMIRAQVLELLSKGILNKEAGSVYYMGELIGMDYEQAVEWFKDPNNSLLKVRILEMLNK